MVQTAVVGPQPADLLQMLLCRLPQQAAGYAPFSRATPCGQPNRRPRIAAVSDVVKVRQHHVARKTSADLLQSAELNTRG